MTSSKADYLRDWSDSEDNEDVSTTTGREESAFLAGYIGSGWLAKSSLDDSTSTTILSSAA